MPKLDFLNIDLLRTPDREFFHMKNFNLKLVDFKFPTNTHSYKNMFSKNDG